MSERRSIKEFLNEVEEKLPFWLKENENDLKETLGELEEHILDKTDALEAKGLSREEALRTAIQDMGPPAKIAAEYKRRGTPKLYITEELFPLYLTVLRYAGLVVGLIALIGTPISILVAALTEGDWLAALGQGISGLLIWSVIAAAVITVIFAWLSYEGYFPDDIKRVLKSKELAKQKSTSAQVSVLPPKVTVEYPTTQRPSMKKMEKKLPRGVKKPSELIPGGIFGIIVGILAIVQPITYINGKILSGLGAVNGGEFMSLLLMAGVFWLIHGILEVIHGMFSSWSFEGNRGLLTIRAIVSFVSIPVIVLFLINPQTFPIFWFDAVEGLVVYPLGTDWYWLYYLIFSFITIGVIAGAIHKIYCATILEEEDFFFQYMGDA
ncbi:MAG: hypothetical protein EU536_02795 [Promethearchaeota archaeon]|nr:MAG: hypothetical protein EU536_02795 [Candidatus Lokiarchaeota archaeon]